MLCCVVLCCVVLCCVVLCYVMLYVMICYVMLCYVMLCCSGKGIICISNIIKLGEMLQKLKWEDTLSLTHTHTHTHTHTQEFRLFLVTKLNLKYDRLKSILSAVKVSNHIKVDGPAIVSLFLCGPNLVMQTAV